MGSSRLSKKGKNNSTNTGSTLLGMVLLEEANTLDINKVVSELRGKWKLEVDATEATNETSVLAIEGYNIAIINMPAPIPGDEIEETAGYNYFWENGVDEATKHKGHILVTIMNSGIDPVKENLLYSKVASAVLNGSKSIGIYIGCRTLLFSKEFYLANLEGINENNLPLFIWIYFGIRQENGKQSMYTFGLKEFGKMEMEIINSDNSMRELSDMMFNMASYVLAYDVTLNDGETIGISAEQKLQITQSKGKFLEGETLKIEF